jgi:hypothetical protein
LAGKHNAHCIITAHEDDPVFRKDGNKEIIDYISVQLGGKIVNNMTWRLSEIWHLKQEDFGNKDRVLSVRQTGQRRPMKSRMFASTNTTPASFKLRYEAGQGTDDHCILLRAMDEERSKEDTSAREQVNEDHSSQSRSG